MGKITKIAWCHSTFNPWWGCTNVGPGCDHCYAESDAKRYGHDVWGHGKERRYFADNHWNQPLKWEREAKESGQEWRVFCASMADIFDNEVEQEHRERLWKLIEETPHLTWLLLTKRVGNVAGMLPKLWRFRDSGIVRPGIPKNIRLGITVVNQEEADRDIDKLLRFGRSFHPWISAEPQLGPIDYSKWLDACGYYCDHKITEGGLSGHRPLRPLIEQIVTGGESGHKARPYDIAWAIDTIRQCKESGVACFVKQLGAVPVMNETLWRGIANGNPYPLLSAKNRNRAPTGTVPLYYTSRKADDTEEWLEDLRIREFPTTEARHQ